MGIVLHQDTSHAKKAAGRKASLTGDYSLQDHYLDQFQYLPGLKRLLGTASLVDGAVKSASDYSYSADRYSGKHFRIIGDASGMVYIFPNVCRPSLTMLLSLYRSTVLVGSSAPSTV